METRNRNQGNPFWKTRGGNWKDRYDAINACCIENPVPKECSLVKSSCQEVDVDEVFWSECRRRELLVGRRHCLCHGGRHHTIPESHSPPPWVTFYDLQGWQRFDSRTRNRRATVLRSLVGDEDVQVVGVLFVYSFSCQRFTASSSPS